jgi:hypothetical protein
MSDALKRIATLAKMMTEAKAEVERAKDDLARANDAFRRLEREDLPQLMFEFGLQSIKLSDGSVVEVVEDLDTSISAERREVAHEWLTEHGFAGIIKSNISVNFDREELEEAKKIAQQISGMTGHPVEIIEKIHPQTLKAFVKEQIAAGTEIPFDVFGIHPFNRAKLKSA